MGDLTKNFSRWEFACKCGCGFDDINTDFVKRLQLLRDECAFGFTINSGCRCRAHNTTVTKNPASNSEHLRGLGVDIHSPTSAQKFRIVEVALRHGFRRIGFHSSFIHLGADPSLPQNVMWPY